MTPLTKNEVSWNTPLMSLLMVKPACSYPTNNEDTTRLCRLRTTETSHPRSEPGINELAKAPPFLHK